MESKRLTGTAAYNLKVVLLHTLSGLADRYTNCACICRD